MIARKATFFALILALVLAFPLVSAATNDAIAGYTYDDADLTAGLPDDVSGSGEDATANSADTGATGIIGEAFDYELSNSDSTTYTDLDLTPPFAISLWWKPETTGVVQGLITKRDGSNNDNFLNYRIIAHDSDTFKFYAANTVSGAYCSLTSTTTFSAGTWYNVIVNVPSSGNCEIFVDGGTAEDSSAVSGTIYTHNTAFYTGKNTPSAGYADGVIDELYIYDHVLSGADITELYNSGNGYQPYAAASSNASVQADDIYTSSAITNFTVTFDGSNYSTTNGTVILPVLTNTSSLWNLTYYSNQSGGYFARSYDDVNLTNIHTGELHQAEITFNASNRVTGSAVTSFTTNTSSNGGSASETATNPQLNVSAGNDYQAEFAKNTYWPAYTTFNASALDQTTQSFEVYDHKLNVTITVAGGTATDQNFTANLYWQDGTFAETVTTTNGYIEFNVTHGNWTVWINDSLHTLTSKNITLNSTDNLTALDITVYTTNALTLNVYDEVLETLITQNVTFEFVSDIDTRNSSTTNGTLYIDLLEPVNYTVFYQSLPPYQERIAYITITNRTSQERDLYLINGSADNLENVSVIIIDQTGAPVEGYRVQVQKYFFSQNSYLVVEEADTDIDGTVRVQVQLYNEFYRFTILDPDGEVVKNTEPATVKKNEFTIQINTEPESLLEWSRWDDISYALSWNDTTNTFRATYTAGSGLASNMCFTAYRVQVTGSSVVNSSCSTSASATILLGVDNATGAQYVATLTATDPETGDQNILGSIEAGFAELVDMGLAGIFLQFFLSLAAFGLTWKNPRFALLTVPLSLIVGRLFTLTSWPYELLFALFVAGVIIAWGVNRR